MPRGAKHMFGSLRERGLAIAIATGLLLQPVASSLAGVVEELHNNIRPSLTLLKATAIDKDDKVKHTERNGFFVSEHGLVLTVYSLISSLGDVDTTKIDFKAVVKRDNQWSEEKAVIVNVSHRLDLVLLKTSGYDISQKAVVMGDMKDLGDHEIIYSSSFSEDPKNPRKNGQVGTANAEHPQVLTTSNSMKFEDEDEGSPVYRLDGTVIGIGIGKGVIGIDNRHNFIPLHFADSILAPAQVITVQDYLADLFNKLQARIQWRTKIERTDAGNEVFVVYVKPFSITPYPTSIEYQFIVKGTDPNGQPINSTTFPIIADEGFAKVEQNQDDEFSGRFLINDALSLLNTQSKVYKWKDVFAEIFIIPKLSDGTRLERVKRSIIFANNPSADD